MTSCDNPPIGTDLNKYVECPNSIPNNLEFKDPKNYNYYDASEWGVRLIPHSEEYNTANPIPTHIRVVWSDFGATAINSDFTIKYNGYIVSDNPISSVYQGTGSINSKPPINTLVFMGGNLQVGGQAWAKKTPQCGSTTIASDFKFVTYYYDILTTQDDNDYIFIYTISDGINTANNFTSYFIVPSKQTKTLHTFVGDNGVSFGNSLGSGSTDGAYGANVGTTLAMKNFLLLIIFLLKINIMPKSMIQMRF